MTQRRGDPRRAAGRPPTPARPDADPPQTGQVAVGAAARAHGRRGGAGHHVRPVRRPAGDDGQPPARVLPARAAGPARSATCGSTSWPTRPTASTPRSPPRAAWPARPASRSWTRSGRWAPTCRSMPPRLVPRPRAAGRPAGARGRRGLPGRLGAGRTRSRRSHRRAAGRPRVLAGGPAAAPGGRPARQPRLVRRAVLVPAQLLPVLGQGPGTGRHRPAAAVPVGAPTTSGAGPRSSPAATSRSSCAGLVAVGAGQPAGRARSTPSSWPTSATHAGSWRPTTT